MSYNARDLLFDCLKEPIKEGLQNDVRQQCDKMRLAVMTLAPEQREICFAMIDEYERARLLRIESDASQAGVVKEMIKLAEDASCQC